MGASRSPLNPLTVAGHLGTRLVQSLKDWGAEGAAAAWQRRYDAALRNAPGLEKLGPRYLAWLVTDPADGILRHARAQKLWTLVSRLGALLKREAGEGDLPGAGEWEQVMFEFREEHDRLLQQSPGQELLLSQFGLGVTIWAQARRGLDGWPPERREKALRTAERTVADAAKCAADAAVAAGGRSEALFAAMTGVVQRQADKAIELLGERG